MFIDIVNNGYNNIKIIGINGINFSGEDSSGMISENSLPWLQDNSTENIWDSWNVELRDFIIFNPDGEYYAKINLTQIDPMNDQNYNEIKNLLINALEQ